MTASPDGASPAGTAETAFLAFAERSRARLSGCALLLTGDADRAERLAGSAVARRYPLGREPDAWTAALRDLVRGRPALLDPPWAPRDRVQLVDAARAPLAPLLDELQRVAPRPRAALVLRAYAGLTSAQVAEVLGTEAATVDEETRQAVEVLAERRPERRDPGRLAAELAAVAGSRSVEPGSAAVDLAHARLLVRRGRLRRGTALLAAVAVAVLVVVGVVRTSEPPPVASAPATTAPASTPSPSRHPDVVSARCDIKNPECQATVMREWRTQMARVTVDHVDSSGRYFTGYSFSYDSRYETPSFWKGGDGALGLEVFRLTGGATEVYLQIATGYPQAVRCGRTTGQRCTSMRFLDGNTFSLSTGTDVSRGMEVQYAPDGDQVITVVARNTTRGKALPITRGELVQLVQDPRLRLPVI